MFPLIEVQVFPIGLSAIQLLVLITREDTWIATRPKGRVNQFRCWWGTLPERRHFRTFFIRYSSDESQYICEDAPELRSPPGNLIRRNKVRDGWYSKSATRLYLGIAL